MGIGLVQGDLKAGVGGHRVCTRSGSKGRGRWA